METLSANETVLKQDSSLLSTDWLAMLVQHMHWRNLHKTSASTMARVASFVKLTVQNTLIKTEVPLEKKQA